MAATIQQQIAQVDAQIAELQAVRRWLEQQSSNGVAPRKRRGPRPAGKVTIADAAEKILKKTGTPMTTSDLLARVRSAGAACGSSETLYKTLARSPRFKKTGRGEWGLAE